MVLTGWQWFNYACHIGDWRRRVYVVPLPGKTQKGVQYLLQILLYNTQGNFKDAIT